MIREVTRDDIPVCVDIIRKSFKTVADELGFTIDNAPRFTAFATTEERLYLQMDNEPRQMFVYEKNGVICGYYSLLMQDNNECELNNLAALPEYRHCGIGKTLLEHAYETARNQGSIETPGISVLDEYYWLNKHDPNYSLCRASEKCGQDAHTDKLFTLDKQSALALSKLFMTPEKDLEDKKISDILPDSFWSTNFWLYWQTMFAFQRWSSALEMKRYLCRYCHHIDGLPDFTALRFTKYNQFESMILPLT